MVFTPSFRKVFGSKGEHRVLDYMWLLIQPKQSNKYACHTKSPIKTNVGGSHSVSRSRVWSLTHTGRDWKDSGVRCQPCCPWKRFTSSRQKVLRIPWSPEHSFSRVLDILLLPQTEALESFLLSLWFVLEAKILEVWFLVSLLCHHTQTHPLYRLSHQGSPLGVLRAEVIGYGLWGW